MAITIGDVAKEANVSVTTVSRVLNNNSSVKAETREKVERVMKKLKYRPNIMARALTSKKSSMIGIIAPGITNLFFSVIVEAIGKCVKSKGYWISLCNTSTDPEEERALANEMVSRGVDGIIIIAPSMENKSNGFYEDFSKKLPMIIVSSVSEGGKYNLVCYDEEIGTREAFKHLIDLEHKKIAFVKGHRSYSYDLKERIYKETLKDNNLSYEEIVNVGKAHNLEVVERTQIQLEELLKKPDRPTAIFACNDLMALGAINACNRLSINVPDDISIIGFDNTILSQISHPKLTTVDQHMEEIGYKAGLELLYIIEQDIQSTKRIIINTNLVIRDSSKQCKKLSIL